MATCVVCRRKPGFGNSVSFSHRLTKRRWNINLQRRHMVIDGQKRQAHICTRCMRTQLKQAAQ
ncbi:MAG: 50S ribosomal protein L28 [Dehalococcoidia bacterium]|nr:50S ribosomal protein L28 [Dehalococcoidia bacterium]